MPKDQLEKVQSGFIVGSLVRRIRTAYYGWYLVAAGVGLGFLGALNNYGFGVFFLPITRELALTRAQTSLVFSAARLEGGLEAPIAGWLTDKLGPRTMLLAGNTLRSEEHTSELQSQR